MAVDVRIGAVEAHVSATDPAVLRGREFLDAVVAAVKEELARDRQLEARREADRATSPRRRPY